jgi:hypothetical protein
VFRCANFRAVIDGTNGQNSTSDDDFDRAIKALADGTAGKARYRELSAADRLDPYSLKEGNAPGCNSALPT